MHDERIDSSSESAPAPSAESLDPADIPRLVVGIGASAGGLEALERFFDAMPPDGTGCAFVVIQHLAPDFKSLMDELLRRHTDLPVQVAENDQPLRANSIYLIPPRFDMIMSGGRLLLSERDNSHTLNLPIDIFFKSMATDLGERAVAVVLSGTGSDGSRGIVSVQDAGGLVIVQDPDTAGFDGMPNAAIATNAVDARLAPGEMPEFILRAAGLPSAPTHEAAGHGETAIYAPVFELLSDHHSVDFHQYKLATIARRIERRIRLSGCSDVAAYLTLLHDQPEQVTVLYHDLLIGVTEFFRDEDAWRRLAESVIPRLYDEVDSDGEIRCWVAGTASGQEAYTLAILLHEEADQRGVALRARIFATDLHQNSIELAGQGVYPKESIAMLSEERRERFFVEREGDLVQVSSDIRKTVVFAQHNLINDPPFTNLDLITCRNVLIYLQPQAQLRALTRFQFGLRRNGVLMLGSSESIGELDTEFETIDRQNKIFVKHHDRRFALGLREMRTPMTLPRRSVTPALGDQTQLLRAYDALLERYVPPAILIDAGGGLLHTFGEANAFLRPMTGRTTFDITELVYEELRLPLVSGLQRLQREGSEISYRGVRVQRADDEIVVDVHLSPLTGASGATTVLVTIDQTMTESALAEVDTSRFTADGDAALEWENAVPEHLKELEAELRFARENLQTTVEELETTNEELQATNEELAASNEELQSSNEELHSVNEELYTVNREYEVKIEELTQLTDDMENLLESTQIGTIFLDGHLRVRKFTPAAGLQFNLLPQDIGRPIAHLSRNVEVDGFTELLDAVLDTGDSTEFEVQHHDGQWYLMRLHPYNVRGAVAGVVITLIDIHTMKHVSANLARSNADLRGFAYGASHDLQEPVRVITSLGDVLARRLREVPDLDDDHEVEELLDQVRLASTRLRAMLDAMLVFSRVDTRAGEHHPVALDDVLRTVTERRADELAELGATIDVDGRLPSVVGEAHQLTWLLGELITNSCKFRAESPPHVTVTAVEESADVVRVSVADNGIGIAPNQREEVFDLFRRLRVDGDVPGVGAGLTICRRIVERHGGEIHVDGATEDGAVIWFTLPLRVHRSTEAQPHEAAS